ncbi:hypothetical protein [Cupriavidus basilensis]|uniref:hypothetical protein n=1 Tax=Cupriavidus basilensis TaxID=68895 RepID=UPI00157B7747|nr:hypothetical protein [Cupriavidus basilensis]NUA26088.1 hypothetical protein [Cupriavidus basilensis]
MTSPFSGIFARHDEAKRAAAAAEEAKVAESQSAEADFISAFQMAINLNAMPLFEQFVADAKANGYAAKIERVDGEDNAYCDVRFIPVPGIDFGPASATAESVFRIKGLFRTQKVEHTSFYDQRPTKTGAGTKRSTFAIQSVKEATIQRGLEEFLKDALESRSQ